MSKGNLKGELILIGETQFITDKFKKRSLVILTDGFNGEYKQTIEVELQQDKVDLADKFKVGSRVDCSYDLRGRKWTNKEGVDKYFNTIVCWNITPIDEAPLETTNEAVQGDDLPF